MCPVCIATAALIASGAGGTIGLAAIFVARIGKRNIPTETQDKEGRNGEHHD
jgi:hypothetical protein